MCILRCIFKLKDEFLYNLRHYNNFIEIFKEIHEKQLMTVFFETLR